MRSSPLPLALVLVLVALAGPAVSAKPDLTVSSVGQSPPSSGPVIATILNDGDVDIAADDTFMVTVSLDGELCHQVVVEGLASGADVQLLAEPCVPAIFGAVDVTVLADADDDIDEDAEDNNSVTATLNWLGPDLVVSSIGITPALTPVGEGLLNAVITNIGGLDVSAAIAVSATLDGAPCSEGVIEGGLAKGTSAGVALSGCGSAAPGVHEIVVTVDPDGQIAEGNEGNNASSQPLFWYAPDLVVLSANVFPDLPAIGEGEVVASIANSGLINAPGPVVVEFRLDDEVCATEVLEGGMVAGLQTQVVATSCASTTGGVHTITIKLGSAS